MAYCCFAGRKSTGCYPGVRGLGFIPLLIGAAGAAAPLLAQGGAKDAARAQEQAAELAFALEKKKMRSEEASSRIAQAQSQGGQVLRYALFGGAGLLIVGALGIWLLTRKKG